MTTEDNESAVIPEVLKQNIETLEELNQRFVSVLQNKKQIIFHSSQSVHNP